MKKSETKYFDIGVEDNQLYHNLGWGTTLLIPVRPSSIALWFNPWINIPQGTSRAQRIGDGIIPRGMSINMFLANKQDRPNTQYRVIVARLPKVFNGILTTNAFDPFQDANSGLCGNNHLKPADTDKGVKFLYDRIHRLSMNQYTSGAGGAKEFTKSIKLWIKRKGSKAIKYDTTSSTLVNNPVAVYVIPYEQFSTLTTDQVGSVTGFMRMYYKDP